MATWIHPRQFLNNDGILDVTHPCPAVFFRENNPEQPQLRRLFHGIQWKLLRFVPGENVRREFGLRELTHHLAQLILLIRKRKLHG